MIHIKNSLYCERTLLSLSLSAAAYYKFFTFLIFYQNIPTVWVSLYMSGKANDPGTIKSTSQEPLAALMALGCSSSLSRLPVADSQELTKHLGATLSL